MSEGFLAALPPRRRITEETREPRVVRRFDGNC